MTENFADVDINNLTSAKMSLHDYKVAHQSMVILCHDVFIEYKNGILLISRNNHPAKDILWPIGGRVERGTKTVLSLKKKVKEECNLELDKVRNIGFARTFFNTEPFGHNKGTDTFNIVYYAKGFGTLKLDDHHKYPTIFDLSQMGSLELHPYVKEYLSKIRDWKLTKS